MRFFMISNPKSKRYKDIKDDVEIFNGLWFDDDLSQYYKDYNIPYNIKEHRKNSNIALSQNHISLLNKIIDEDLFDTVILEDDVIYSVKDIENKLQLLNMLPNAIDSILYLGGIFWGKLIKDKNIKINDEDKVEGLHMVKDYFTILGTQGYYIKTPQIAQKILLAMRPGRAESGKYYSHCIDACFRKMKLNKYYIQPSLVKHNLNYKSIIGNNNQKPEMLL